MTRCSRCGNGWVTGHQYNGHLTEGGCMQCGEAYTWRGNRWERDTDLAIPEQRGERPARALDSGDVAWERLAKKAAADFDKYAARQAKLAARVGKRGAR